MLARFLQRPQYQVMQMWFGIHWRPALQPPLSGCIGREWAQHTSILKMFHCSQALARLRYRQKIVQKCPPRNDQRTSGREILKTHASYSRKSNRDDYHPSKQALATAVESISANDHYVWNFQYVTFSQWSWLLLTTNDRCLEENGQLSV